MKKTLILHIGMGKTGTTALQQFFWNNREPLKESGVCYPQHASIAHAHHLVSPHTPDFLDDSWEFLRVEEWAPVLAKLQQPTILLSSELICWAEADAVTRFCEEISEWFDLRVVIYLRRQDNILMAAYQQQVKSGQQKLPIEKVLERQLEKFDYLQILAPWDQALGTDKIIVRPYEQQQFFEGDIRKDFMHHVLELSTDGKYEFSSSNVNQSLFGSLSVYKLIINNLVENSNLNGRFSRLLADCSENSGRAIFSDHTALSAEKRLEIIEHSQPVNSAIASKYLDRSDGELFFDPLPIEDQKDAAELSQAECLREISDQLIAKDARLMEWLAREAIVSFDAKDVQRSMAARIMSEVLPSVPDEERSGDTRSMKDFWANTEKTQRFQGNILGSRQTKFERIYLHIGLGKTGTTSIQGALLAGADELAENCDLLFPSGFNLYKPFDGNLSLYLTSLFAEQPEKLSANVLAGLTTSEAAAAANRKFQKQFQEQLESSTQNKLLISAEGIGHFDGAALVQLKRWLDQIADAVEIIACLRHPLHAVSAEIQQRLTIGFELSTLYRKPPHYQYQHLLTRLEKVFPRESITVYDYADVLQNKLGSVGAFLDRLGIEDSSWVQQEERLNQAYSYEAVLLIDALNRLRPLLKNDKRNPLRSTADLRDFMHIPGRKFVPPTEVYATLTELASPHLVWLEEHYGLVLDPLNAGEAATSTVPPDLSRDTIDALALQLSDYSNLKAAAK